MRRQAATRFVISVFLLVALMGPLAPFHGVARADGVTFYATASDGYLSGGGYDYYAAHNAASGSVNQGNTANLVGQFRSYGGCAIHRSALFFNTAYIPDTATITGASLRLYGTQGFGTGYSIAVVRGADLNDPLVAGDYGDLLDETASLGQMDIAQWTTGGWNIIQLNSNGLAQISKTGITKLALRSTKDIEGIDPPFGAFDYAGFRSAEGGSPAMLCVSWTVGTTVPTVYNMYAFNVGNYTATLKGWLIDDGGEHCEYRFEWGLTPNYGNATPWTGSITSGSYFYAGLSGLTPDTTYHFRFRPQCKNSAGVGSGCDLTFTTPPIGDDSFPPEVGVEWVNGYPGWGHDLSLSDDSTAELAAALQGQGWSLQFNNPPDGQDGRAWEKHFKSAMRGGWDYLYADSVDLVMFSGHGDPGRLIFGGSSQDDEYLYGYEAYWGDIDLEWALLEACSALAYDDGVSSNKYDGWFAQALGGARLICGAATSIYGDNGQHVGPRLAAGWSVMDAWFWGCFENQDFYGHSCTLRVIAEDPGYFGDAVWGCGPTIIADPIVDNYYYCLNFVI